MPSSPGASSLPRGTREHILEALNDLDTANIGSVDVVVLRKTMQALDSKWKDDDFDRIIKATQLEQKGRIDIQAFIEWIFPESPPKAQRPFLQRLPQKSMTMVEVIPPISKEKSMSRNYPEVSSIEEGTIIEYLTDVEGNFLFFLQYVSMSEILYWDESEDQGVWGPGTLKMKDNGIFVFGGDSVDKGPGDIRFVKHLLYLKNAYWDKVFIVLGNRDLNKLRFFAELAEGEDGSLFEQGGGPYWVKPEHQKKYADYLTEKQMDKGLISTLKWMLDCNMGCQKTTFKMRRRELANVGCRSTEEDTLLSFRESVDPDGADPFMLDLLSVGQLAVLLGDALFVHAGLNDKAIGMVPFQSSQIESVQEWVKALNNWKDVQLQEYRDSPLWREEPGAPGGGSRRRGGEWLIDYGAPGGCGGISVVYQCPFNNGNPHTYSERVEDYLSASGIRRVISGHQPHGESPTVVRHVRSGLLAVTCDTSYSNMGALKVVNESNMRGEACCVVRLDKESIQFNGLLSDGTKHTCKMLVGSAADSTAEIKDSLVGRQLRDGSWVKTITKSGEVLTALGVGFSVSVQKMNVLKARLLLKPEYAAPRFHVRLHELTGEILCSHQLLNQYAPEAEPDPDAFTGSYPDYEHMKINPKLFHEMETYIFDCYGTIWNAVHAAPSPAERAEQNCSMIAKVNELIDDKSKRVMFATNDCNQSRVEVLQKLRKHSKVNVGREPFDKDLDDETLRKLANKHIITSGFTCAWFLKTLGIRRPLVLCSKTGFLDELKGMGIEHYIATIDNDGTPKAEFGEGMNSSKVMELVQTLGQIDCVVIGWDEYFTALKSAVAAAYLAWSRQGPVSNPIRLICCSKDTHAVIGVTPSDFHSEMAPSLNAWGDKKVLGLGNGFMCQTICANAGLHPNYAIDCGRPSPIFSETLRRSEDEMGYNVDLSKAVMIGDTLGSDMELANRSGMYSVLVMSGVTTRKELESEQDPMRWPTWVVESVAHIPSKPSN